ncbi:MAG TPA: glycosyltransferase N-terminal domain-containing protein, partial [Turneriella sp.]|nr:glycosyltransferase N-terminal domain-containing protein [Turneriella sp.]
LVSATLPEASKRYQWPLKNFLHRVYAPMRQIFAINEEHAERLRRISPLNVSIAGDTRFDAIRLRLAEGKEKQKQIEPIRRLFVGRKIIVGGSTYAASEKIILEYLHPKPTVQKKPVVAILAPHHVHEARISSIEALCHNFSLTALRLSQVGQSSIRKKIDVLIVDSLGVLPHLYPLADVAYVGGGFEGSVHSVIEAALAGVAVVTGPFIQNSAEAMDLQRECLLVAMEKQSCTLFAQIVENLCINKIKNARKAAAFAKERVGASQKIMHTVMDDISVNSMLA